MEPKRSSEYIKPTAKLLNIEEKVVSDIIKYYWKDVRRALTDLECPSVSVLGFGKFNIKPTIVKKLHEKYTRITNSLCKENMSFRRHTIYNISVDRLDKITNMLKLLAEESKRKQEVKIKRTDYVINRNLEE